MPPSLSITHLVAPAEVGGLESVLRLLASCQRARGHDVRVLAVLPHEQACAAWVNGLRAAGVPVQCIVAPGRNYVREWQALHAALRAGSPDVVHTHGYRVDVLGGSAARRARIPVVSTVHGFTGGDWKNRLYEQLQRQALRHFDAVVAVSRLMGVQLTAGGVRERALHVVPNAFAPTDPLLDRSAARRLLRIPDDQFHAAWVGRLSHEKGADVMLDALAAPLARGMHLSVIGDGAERERLVARSAQLAVEARVTWHGVRHDAGRLLKAFDALVLSSRTEGTPMVLLEAMAAGVPVVATRVGGVPDVVDEAHALLVEPERPAAIAAALAAVRADPAAALVRASRASARVADAYAPAPWLDRYDAVYRAALRAGGRIAA